MAVLPLRNGNPNRLKLLRALNKGGARIVAGTDTGMPFVSPGLALHWELQLFEQAGFTPFEALKTATMNAAKCLGKDDLGSIQTGHRADLVLLSANPLDDIENVSKIDGVMMNGKWLPRGAIDAMLKPLIRDERH